ncbi:hypothetical protein [Rhodoflexus sp.]
MEDIEKIILSIVAAVAYFIYQSLTGVKQQRVKRPGKTPNLDHKEQPVAPPAKVSFEELLKELEEKIQQQIPPPPVEETIEDRKNRKKKKLEATSSVPFSYEDKYQQPDAQAEVERIRMRQPFIATKKPVEQATVKSQAVQQHPLTTILSDVEQLRSAFVLSEIFNRKW